jgi:putative endonuclease
MFYTYILRNNELDELYIGSTKDLKKRIVEHNKRLVKSTKYKSLYVLIYYEAYKSESDARRRESMLKLRGQARKQLLLRLKDTLKN